ncbi:peptide MFS transporter [Luteimonas sp. RIT-PG2_3]
MSARSGANASAGNRHHAQATTPDAGGMIAPGGTWLGYPKGVFLLSFTELWERFSYWGMLALLVLFLTASLDSGGFGWDRETALKLYGFYTGLAFVAPVLGGWIANRWWGERRCILVGGLLLIAGHACLSGPAVLPWLIAGGGAHALELSLQASGIPLGALWPDAAQQQALLAAGGTEVLWLYRGTTFTFHGGLAMIIAGTALLKPTVSSIVATFYRRDDHRRDGAFAVFFFGLYLGAFAANIVVGFLGERIGWHWGFGAAGVGMTIGMLAYLWKQQAWLGDLGREAPGRSQAQDAQAQTQWSRLDRQAWERIGVIVVQGLFTMCYAAAFYQKGGVLTLFTRDSLDRSVSGWEVPVTWLLAISTVTFLITTPLFARYWQYRARLGRDPSASTKLALGLAMLGIGYAAIAWAAAGLPDLPGARASWLWIVVTYICFGIGDALVWPNQISLTSKLAPPGMAPLFIGGWYITIGLGSWLTGYIGMIGYDWGMAPLFVMLSVGGVGLGLLLYLLTPALRRRMHGAE